MELFGGGEQRVLVLGGMHGNEPESVTLARRLAEYLRENPAAIAGATVAIIPEVNPDGLRRGSRTNVDGVDLNRNFPSTDWRAVRLFRHGAAPASEPETQAVVNAISQFRPNRIVDIHSISGGRECNNYDGPGEHLAAVMSSCNGYPVEASIGYPTPGCLGSWTGIDDHIPTITLELPRGEAALKCWRVNKAALLAFVDGGSGFESDVQPPVVSNGDDAGAPKGQ